MAEPIPVDQLPARLAAVLCDQLGPCCSASGSPYDVATCRANLLSDATTFFGEPPTDVDYDPDAAGECVRAIAAAIRLCREPPTFRSGICRHIYVGHVPPGGACKSDRQCAAGNGGAFCNPRQDGTSFCMLSDERAALGKPCMGTFTDEGGGGGFGTGGSPACYTNDGLYCNENSQVCEPLLKLSAACDPTQQYCEPGTYCNATGVCARQRTSGACGSPEEQNACLASMTFCDNTTDFQCRVKRKDGEPCGAPTQCKSDSCGSGPVDATGGSQNRCGIGTPKRCEGHI